MLLPLVKITLLFSSSFFPSPSPLNFVFPTGVISQTSSSSPFCHHLLASKLTSSHKSASSRLWHPADGFPSLVCNLGPVPALPVLPSTEVAIRWWYSLPKVCSMQVEGKMMPGSRPAESPKRSLASHREFCVPDPGWRCYDSRLRRWWDHRSCICNWGICNGCFNLKALQVTWVGSKMWNREEKSLRQPLSRQS